MSDSPHTDGDARLRAVPTPEEDLRGRDGSYSTAGSSTADRQRMLAAEKTKFGGIKFFTAFFGWLTATGTVVLLSALATGIATIAGVGDQLPAATSGAGAATTGLVGSIVLAVVILIGYFAGGYVAGRMARFSGLKQGLAVWIWLVLIALVLAAVAAVVGNRFDVFAQLSSVPNLGALTGVGAIAAAAAAILALIGALLGGLTGMRYHRRVDRAGLES